MLPLITLAFSLVVAPLATQTQPRGHLARLGVLDPSPHQRPAPCLPALAAELIQRAPDVLWLHGNAAAWAAKQATTTIPIVTAVSNELVEEGLVASLAQPGGNLTGLELRSGEVAGKRLELLKATVPTITRVAVTANRRRGWEPGARS
jgi:ABC-type uncharacterized transport system substrate-binding protein